VDPADAKTHASKVAKHLASFGGTSLLLTGEQLLAYRRAIEILGDVPVDVAVGEWAAGKAKRREEAKAQEVDVADIVREMLSAKDQAGRSHAHVRDLRHRLERFADAFHCPLASVTPAQVSEWLLKLKLAPRSRNNFLTAVRSLVRFAERRGHVQKGRVDLLGVERAESPPSEVSIYAPEELGRLVAASREDFLPFVAIGALAGLRTAELCRLDWHEVNEDYIMVAALKAKTRSRRLVPVCPALSALLRPYRGMEGKVVPMENVERLQALTAQAARVDRKKNGLRHSYGTYRLALVKNEAQVALEMGNSPAMLFSNYRGLSTSDAAQRWFSVHK
jgi:integrase